ENHITMTSDAFGSLPQFDEEGNLIQLEMGLLTSLYDEWVDCIQQDHIPIQTALKPITSNPANILKLNSKGRIQTGMDADVLLIDKNLELQGVIAMGKWLMKDKKHVVKGTYE
ncbi:hypothetical protein RZS08_35845, partial [Arthrospira platensis SPKY1]|nr:hypothetical protein [Arthrospira platensis SPKY1]